MPTIHDTAYPRLKSSISEKELNEIYTPTADELDLAHSLTHSTAMRIGFLALLKTPFSGSAISFPRTKSRARSPSTSPWSTAFITKLWSGKLKYSVN